MSRYNLVPLTASKAGECNICKDDVAIGTEVAMLPCTHWFHTSCIDSWLRRNNTYPICRANITGGSNGSSSDDFRVARQALNIRHLPVEIDGWELDLPDARGSTTLNTLLARMGRYSSVGDIVVADLTDIAELKR